MAKTTARTLTPVHPPARSIQFKSTEKLGFLVIHDGMPANYIEEKRFAKTPIITYQVEAARSVDQAGGLAEGIEVLRHFAL